MVNLSEAFVDNFKQVLILVHLLIVAIQVVDNLNRYWLGPFSFTLNKYFEHFP